MTSLRRKLYFKFSGVLNMHSLKITVEIQNSPSSKEACLKQHKICDHWVQQFKLSSWGFVYHNIMCTDFKVGDSKRCATSSHQRFKAWIQSVWVTELLLVLVLQLNIVILIVIAILILLFIFPKMIMNLKITIGP